MSNNPGGSVAIVGIGEGGYFRRSEIEVPSMVFNAAKAAIADAGLAIDEIDAIVTEGEVVPKIITPDELAAGLGLPNHVFSATTSLAGAGIVAGPLVAAALINSGLAQAVLCYSAVDYGSDPNGPYAFHASDQYKASLEMPFGFYGQPIYFAPVLRRFQHEYGLKEEDIADFVVSTREWAIRNPNALCRKPLTASDYFASPILADPIRVLDCCLVNDAAAAFVMTSTERARDLRHSPIVAAGFSHKSSVLSGHSYLTQRPDYLSTHAVETVPRALAMAGLELNDIDFAEIYDCFTISCLMQIVDSGLCKPEELGDFISSGRTGPNGIFPINTNGGQLSQAYTLGINHVIEAVLQLRGDAGERQLTNPQVGWVAGYGGWDHTSLILTVDK